MPTSTWTLLRDLGLIGAVGSVTVAAILGLGKLCRVWWASRKRRSEQDEAHIDATFALLSDRLGSVPSEEVAAAAHRSASVARLEQARERLSRWSRARAGRA